MNTEKPKHRLIFSLTPRGDELGERLERLTGFTHFSAAALKAEGGIMNVTKAKFLQASALIFIGATGIAVRAIAPCLQDKFSDPAVLVLDEKGKHVISLLSGHIGGANTLAVAIAEAIEGEPVLTTATDVNGRGSLDLLLKDLDCPLKPYRDLILKANMALATGSDVGIYIDLDFTDWLSSVPGFVFYKDWELFQSSDLGLKIYIGPKQSKIEKVQHAVVPKIYALGTGVKKNQAFEVYQEGLLAFLKQADLSPQAIQIAASITLKQHEPCLHEAANAYAWQLEFYETASLKTFESAFESSDWVMKTVGLGSVSGPCALKATGLSNAEDLILKPFKHSGCTYTLGRIHK